MAGGPRQTDCSPSPSSWQWGRGLLRLLAPRLTSEAPARENGPAAIHAPRSNTSAQHQTGRGRCAKLAGWQGKHRHSWAEAGGGPVPAHGVQQPARGFGTRPWGSAPSCGAWYPAAGLGTQLWCSSPGHGAQHPTVGLSTQLWGLAPRCAVQHTPAGFSTQLRGPAPSLWHCWNSLRATWL